MTPVSWAVAILMASLANLTHGFALQRRQNSSACFCPVNRQTSTVTETIVQTASPGDTIIVPTTTTFTYTALALAVATTTSTTILPLVSDGTTVTFNTTLTSTITDLATAITTTQPVATETSLKLLYAALSGAYITTNTDIATITTPFTYTVTSTSTIYEPSPSSNATGLLPMVRREMYLHASPRMASPVFTSSGSVCIRRTTVSTLWMGTSSNAMFSPTFSYGSRGDNGNTSAPTLPASYRTSAAVLSTSMIYTSYITGNGSTTTGTNTASFTGLPRAGNSLTSGNCSCPQATTTTTSTLYYTSAASGTYSTSITTVDISTTTTYHFTQTRLVYATVTATTPVVTETASVTDTSVLTLPTSTTSTILTLIDQGATSTATDWVTLTDLNQFTVTSTAFTTVYT